MAYRLTGPQILTPLDELAELASQLRRPLRAVEPALDHIRTGMATSGMPEHMLDALFARTLDTDRDTEVLSTVAEILGRPPRTFAQWTTAHLAHFTPESGKRS